MTEPRRFLVIGLGSMGKRRVRNLKRLGITDIVGFDPREDRRNDAARDYGIATSGDIEEAYGRRPDAVVISTPPDLHVRYARDAVKRGLPFFMEASVVDDDMAALAQEAAAAKVVAAPSCTMRFNPSVKTLKRLVTEGRIGRVLAYTHHSGQYLPDWHPWEDYRRFYAGQRRTGACREIVPFELIWLTWIVGPVSKVASMRAKTSELDVDIDDVYQLVLEHGSRLLGHLLVDVVARDAIRRCTVLGTEGTLVWDWAGKRVMLYEASSKSWSAFEEERGTVQPGYVHAEEPYVEEMKTYLTALRGGSPWPYRLEDDLAVLGLLGAAERSSDTGEYVRIDRR